MPELTRKQKREIRRIKRREKIRKVKEGIKKEARENFQLNMPNIATLSRLILTFLVVYMIFSGYSRIAIAIVFVIAALTDTLDGTLARRFNMKSQVGARLDQVIDRIFTLMIVIALVIYFIIGKIADKNLILMLFLISSREILGTAGLAIRIVLNKDPYQVKYIGKLTTLVQSITLFFIIAGFSFSIYFAILTCIIGILAGFDYLKDSVS